MVKWKKIEICDKDFFAGNTGAAMLSFNSAFIWQTAFDTKLAVVGNDVFLKGCTENGETLYFPCSLTESIKDTLPAVLESFEKKPKIYPVTKEQADVLSEVLGIGFHECDSKYEYVYSGKNLRELSGKKYHGKRNHIAKFDSMYGYDFELITKDNFSLLENAVIYFKDICPEDEYSAIKNAVSNFDALGLKAGVLTVSGKIAAYSIGSLYGEKFADIHFEKADRNYEGSYSKINNLFACSAFPEVMYINREEDLGIEGLRKAKMSYHPEYLVQMYEGKLN